MAVIRISDSLHKRLEKHAIGFDTPANVIERLLDKVEGVETEEKETLQTTGILPIKLFPEDPETFKLELLKKREATMFIYYNDGRVEEKKWNASKFTKDSNLMGNLRSKSEFRQGNWQELGIESVSIKIV
jgi:hypothetical protein